MDLPSLSSTSVSEFNGIRPILVVAGAVRDRRSGILRIQTDKIIRQISWSEGNCVGCLSNAKTETAGGFLQKKGRLNEEQLKSFLQEMRKPKVNAWQVAAKLANLPPEEVASFKLELVLQLATTLGGIETATVRHQP